MTKNTIVYADDIGMTTIENATDANMEQMTQRLTNNLYLELLNISAQYVKKNPMRFGRMTVNVGSEKISAEQLKMLTDESLNLVRAYIADTADAKMFINKYTKHERSEMLLWICKIFDPNGTFKNSVSDMMREWERLTDAGIDTLNEMLTIITDKRKQLV